jgi:hypothetical protein
MRNLLATRPVSDATIGKVEHLKALLVEWMRRMNNGAMGYYSSNKYNNGEGRGDIAEVTNRRTWKQLPYWQSDSTIVFGPPAKVVVSVTTDEKEEKNSTSGGGGIGGSGGRKGVVDNVVLFRRNEYLYLGRTSPGFLVVEPIAVSGPDKDLFSVSLTTKTIVKQSQYVRVTIAFQSPAPVNMTAVEAYLTIQFNGGARTIRLGGRTT